MNTIKVQKVLSPFVETKVPVQAKSKWQQVNFCLSKEFLNKEVYPSIIRVELPKGKKVLNREMVLGYVDRRIMPEGLGWQVSSDGQAFEVYLPLDPEMRSRYLADGGVEYSFVWSV